MGIAIPQVITSDRATGGQVINGSVGFTSESQTRLTRTPSSEGNRKTWTWSAWVKRDNLGDSPVQNKRLFSAQDTDAVSNSYSSIYFRGTDVTGQLEFLDYLSGTREGRMRTEGVFKDTSGWYHVCVAVDYTDSTAKDRIKIYVNGVRQGRDSADDVDPDTTDQTFVNSTEEHNIGKQPTDTDKTHSGRLSQVYLIDGQALGPEYFGFTDPLTNTWRPKKYVNTTASPGDVGDVVGFGTNGFYLPFDGSAPIGQDQSGQGNNWTPVNFGGSVALDNPIVSGARPILNTTQGGTQAGVGVFGSKQNVGYAVTVYDDGGGNKYYIDGVKQDTVTGLIRGATYTFDTSDSTVSSHPFRFSATSNGSHGGGTEYTNGVAAITGAATTITVPHDAPNTLYYYCTSHSGMGADITGITTNEKLADQYASHCVLALPLVGSANDVSTSIACTASTKSVTSNGNAAASSDQSNFYSGSFEFDGTGDYLQTADSSDFTVGSGDYTIEGWFYPENVSSTRRLCGQRASDTSNLQFMLEISSFGVLSYYFSISDSSYELQGDALVANRWYHIAVVRSGDVHTLYVDGNSVATRTQSGTLDDRAQPFSIGRQGDYTSDTFDGYIQDFRFYKGVAKYTSNFVVPSISPDILPDTPSGVSGGSKLAKITDGAVSFDGDGDYLNASNSTDFDISTGDWTIEGFLYAKSPSTTSIFLNKRANGSTYQWITVGLVSGQFAVSATSNGSSWDIISVNTPFGTAIANKWHHWAVVRNGNTFTGYLDGVGTVLATSSSSITTNTTDLHIGSDTDLFSFSGFLSNVRIIKGTALYTSNFTPPTAPLTNVTNTKLLCCQSNTSATAAAVAPGSITNPSSGYSFNTAKIYSVYNGGTRSANFTVEYSDDNSNWTTAFTGTMTTSGCGVVSGSGGGGDYGKHNYWRYTNNEGTGSHHPRMSRLILSDGTTDVTIQTFTSDNCSDSGTIPGNGTSYTYTDTTYVQNNASATNFNPFTTDINTVRGQETGYCTWNPLAISATNPTLSDGNLSFTGGSSDPNKCLATTAMSSGKFYAEFTVVSGSINPGLATKDINLGSGFLGDNAYGWTYGSNGKKYHNDPVATGVAYGDTYTTGDAIGVAFDADNGILTFYKNGVSQGAAYTGLTSGPYFFATGGSSMSHRVNFGQKPFKFPPPDGFQPLNAANVRPETVIARPDQYVGVTTYSGDNTDPRQINLGMAPDLIWVKARNQTNWNWLTDTVRGAPNKIYSNDQQAEDTAPIYGQADSLNDFGFVAGGGTDGVDPLSDSNKTGTDYVVWSWKAGGNKNTFNVDDVGYATAAAAGLTAGTITPTGASVGTKQGFSIIKWTAPDPQDNTATVPHGLTQKPDFWAVKSLDGARDWICYTEQVDGSLDFLHFNNTEVKEDSSATAPTATTFGVYGNNINTAGEDQIAYLWHSVPGLQKFGSYEGNDALDGPFVELGFKPAVILLKNADATQDWTIIDGTRDTFNPSYKWTKPSDSAVENNTNTNNSLDILSNGFKLRGATDTNDMTNGPSQTIIYAAWAEAPSIDLYGGGANAR